MGDWNQNLGLWSGGETRGCFIILPYSNGLLLALALDL